MDARDAQRTVASTFPPRSAGTRPTPRPRRSIDVPPIARVLLASLAARLALWALYVAPARASVLLRDDAAMYHESARALLETGTFSISPALPLVPQTLRTPGYPSFLAAVYAVFGERAAAAVLAQLILGVAGIGLVYLLARRLWGARVALLAAALLALDVASLHFSLLVLTETLFTLLLVGALGCGAALLARPGRRRWAPALGLMLAACCLVRPAAYYLVIPVALGVLAHGWRAWGPRETAWTLALLLVPYAAVVGGWQARNQRVSGSAAFTQADAAVLLLYRGAAIVAARDGIGLDEARARLAAAYGAERDDPRTPADNQRWRRAGIELIRENPGIYARVVAAGMLRTLLTPAGLAPPRADTPPPEPGWRNELRDTGLGSTLRARIGRRGGLYSATFALSALMVLLTTLAAAYAVWRLAAGRRITAIDLYLLGVALYIVLIHAGPSAGPRARVAVAPILAMYAARGLAETWARFRSGARHPALPAP